jgi:hypothetical protein
MAEPRAFTADEVRDQFLQHVRGIAQHWASRPDKTPEQRCKGAMFSMLSLLDGAAMGFPAVSLTLAPHPDDQAYCRENGDNWYESGMVFNDGEDALHELFFERPENPAEGR